MVDVSVPQAEAEAGVGRKGELRLPGKMFRMQFDSIS